MYNLSDMVENHLQEKGRQSYKSFHFGRVKVKFQNNGVKWSKIRDPGEESSEIRVVKMENTTDVKGTGHIAIQKERKPVCKFTLDKGVLKGFTKRVKFNGPDGVFSTFLARVDERQSTLLDGAGLLLEMNVPLNVQTQSFAEVKNSTHLYEGKFEATASLSGMVVIINDDDTTSEFPITDIFGNDFTMKGSLSVNFQNTHNIDVD